jgi:hypothetical protein
MTPTDCGSTWHVSISSGANRRNVSVRTDRARCWKPATARGEHQLDRAVSTLSARSRQAPSYRRSVSAAQQRLERDRSRRGRRCARQTYAKAGTKVSDRNPAVGRIFSANSRRARSRDSTRASYGPTPAESAPCEAMPKTHSIRLSPLGTLERTVVGICARQKNATDTKRCGSRSQTD